MSKISYILINILEWLFGIAFVSGIFFMGIVILNNVEELTRKFIINNTYVFLGIVVDPQVTTADIAFTYAMVFLNMAIAIGFLVSLIVYKVKEYKENRNNE